MNKVELLAPVKDAECLRAVIESGADSIYMGYQHFNARMFGKNFTELELYNHVKYAHNKNVKVYLTLNTLIREDEMDLAIQMATQAVRDHVDALIVQDIGLAAEIQKHIPNASIHASTQMSICNHYGVRVLHDLGYRRVVLARELNYLEIISIKQACLSSNDMPMMEIEAFIHGGLCIAYSGQCFSSSYCFGSSANRGKCLMTCWKGYELKTAQRVLETGSLIRPRDLEGLHVLKHLIEGGIDCLKIQGRLRSCEYIKEIVNVYREAIDDILDKYESDSFAKCYHKRLSAVSPRGMTGANLFPETGQKMIMDTDTDVLIPSCDDNDSRMVLGILQNKRIAVFLRELNTDEDYLFLRNDIEWVYIELNRFLDSKLQKVIHDLCRKFNVYIYMPPMIYERNCEKVYAEVDSIIRTYTIAGVVLSNVSDLFLIKKYKSSGLKFISGNHIHIFNHFTADRLRDLGVSMGTYSLELPLNSCTSLKNNTHLPLQQIVYGHQDLMHIKYCLLSHCNECTNCGRCNDGEYSSLELNGEASFLIRINKLQTETILYSKTIFSANTTHIVGESLRFDFINESISDINAIIEKIKCGYYYMGSGFKNEV